MSGFYKMDPARWDFGTSSLTLEQEAAYLRIVNAIHKHDQPVPDNDRVLAGMFRCSTRKARGLVRELAAAGKITIEGGQISNQRAISDLVRRGLASTSRAESGAKGGRTRAENARKALENNKPTQATASSRIEENREEKEEDEEDARVATEAAASTIVPLASTAATELHAAIVRQLGLDRTGMLPSRWMPPTAIIEVGRWLTDLHLSPTQVLEAIRLSAANHAEMPRGPRAFDDMLRRYAASLNAPPLEAGDPRHAQQPAGDRRAARLTDTLRQQLDVVGGTRRAPKPDFA